MTDEREVLSALIDREQVDPDVLARVLENPSGRMLLVDFVRLRQRLSEDDASTASAAETVDPRRRRPAREPWLRAAAVFLLLAFGAGGGAWLERYMSRERPPEPDRVVQFDVAGR